MPYNLYRVAHLLVNLGWVDFDLVCSPLCLALPGLMGNWQKWLSSRDIAQQVKCCGCNSNWMVNTTTDSSATTLSSAFSWLGEERNGNDNQPVKIE